MNRKFLLCLFLVAGSVPAATARAEIVFGPATTMSSDTDVSINGDLEYAYSFALEQLTTTVHTVPFLRALADGQSGGVPVITTSLDQVDSTVFNGNDTPPVGSTNASLSAEYLSLVAGAAFSSAGATTTDVTLTGFDTGDEYEVQLWLHDARNISNARLATVTSETNSVTLAYNSSDAIPGGADGNNSGGVGQFVIGTFTANGPTETFTLSVPDGQGGLQLNAIQVRNISRPVLIGDVNLDGFVNFLDIQPFIDLLVNNQYQVEADINQCGVVDFLQIRPFIQLLANQ